MRALTDQSPDQPRRIVVGDLGPPRRSKPPKRVKPETPLFFIGRRDQITLNWRHWAAPLVVLINIIALPLVILLNVLEFVGRFWYWMRQKARHSRKSGSDIS